MTRMKASLFSAPNRRKSSSIISGLTKVLSS